MPHRQIFHLAVVAIASIVSRLSGLATVVVAGWFLTEHDFGVYATALGVTTFTLLLRGGGTGLLLPTLTPKEFAEIGGAAFRTAAMFATIGATLTLAALWPAQSFYREEGLATTMLWIAGSMAIMQLGTYPTAKVASHLRFDRLATIEVLAAIAKLGAAYWCASRGWGPATLAVAQTAAVAVQAGGAIICAGLRLEDFRVPPGWLGVMVKHLRLPIVISMLITVALQADAFVASLFVATESLGLYFFAATMAIAPIQLVVGSIKSVLAPYTARARGTSSLERAAMNATFASGTLFVPLGLVMLATIYPSLSVILWGDKWVASQWPVVLGCVLLIYPTIQGLLEGPIIGLRDWREYLSIVSWRAGSKVAGALAAVAVIHAVAAGQTGTAIALTIGVGGLASIVAFMQIQSLLKRYGVDREFVAFEIHSPTVYAIVGLVATYGLVSSIMGSMLRPNFSARGTAMVECALSFVIFGLIALVLLRFAYQAKLRLILAVVPNPLRGIVTRALRVNT